MARCLAFYFLGSISLAALVFPWPVMVKFQLEFLPWSPFLAAVRLDVR